MNIKIIAAISAVAVSLAGCAGGVQLPTLTSTQQSYVNLAAQEICGQLGLTPNIVPASVLAAAKQDCANTSQGATMAQGLTSSIQAALTAFQAAGWAL